MPTFGVVINLHVVKNLGICILKTVKEAIFEQFGFDAAEKTFGHGIVVMVVFAGHTGKKFLCIQQSAKVIGIILATAITMHNEPFGIFAQP